MKKPILSGLLSTFIWGSGQVYNKQLIKGLFFFAVQIALIVIEIATGDYFAPYFYWREAGLFGRGIWAIITLGTQAGQMTLDGFVLVDHSLMLLIQGLIAILVLSMFILIWIINIKDAYTTSKEFNLTGELLGSKDWMIKTWEKSFAYFIILPAAVMMMFFTLMPLLASFLIAFTNYNINNLPPANLIDWVGLRNFRTLFAMDGIPGGDMWLRTFVQVFIWTLIQAIVMSIFPFAIGLFQAVILNNKRMKFKKLLRSLLILPWAVPTMLTLLNFRQVFNGTFGPLNRVLMQWGIIQSNINWLGDPHNIWIPRMTILAIGLWLGFPYWLAMSSGVMTSISSDIYEAAEIDGATERQQFWKITLPLVVAAVAPLLIMGFSGAFNNFGLIFFLTEGGPQVPSFIHAGGTDILITWIFSLTRDNRLYNMASVMSIFIFIMVASLALWQLPKTRAFKEDI